jgi:hypothetical protein
VNPANPSQVFVGTERGLYASEALGAWAPVPGGPGKTQVKSQFWLKGDLYLGTNGKGAWRAHTSRPPVVSITSPANNATFTAGADITLTSTASDPEGTQILELDYLQGSTEIGTTTNPPYQSIWSKVPAGTYTLTAKAWDAAGLMGQSAPITITVKAPGVAPRNPTADATVKDGTNAGLNFGKATTLEARSAASGSNRDSYLKFDVGGLSGFVSQAKLRVYAHSSTTTSVSASARAVSSSSWSETGLTWNNKPSLGSTLDTKTFTGTASAWYEFNVTSQVRKIRSGAGTAVSLALHEGSTSTASVLANSREASSNKPELTFTMATPTALFVVGNTTLNTGDAAIKTRLTNMGFAVNVVSASAAVSGDATGKNLVIISSTVSATSVGTKFRNVTVPVLNFEAALQDKLGMTGTTSGTNFGTQSTQTQVTMINSSHALSGKLSGTQTIASVSGTYSWGAPASAAVKIATIVGKSTAIADYGYEKGAAMVGMAAPARRVHLFIGDATAATFSSAGWTLFESAVYWTAGF